MKLLLFLTVLFILPETSFSQDIGSAPLVNLDVSTEQFVPGAMRKPAKPRNLYFELGGSGGFGSFNFEWNFNRKHTLRWMLRTGVSGTYIDKNNGVGFIFPVMVHAVYGRIHALDIGLGQAVTITTKGSAFVRMPLSIGYRLEPFDKRVFYRFSYTPIISYLLDFQWQHWGGITIGYKLKHRVFR